MTLVDAHLRIAHHKFDGEAHGQPRCRLMEDSGLVRLRLDGSAARSQQAKYLQESLGRKSTTLLAAEPLVFLRLTHPLRAGKLLLGISDDGSSRWTAEKRRLRQLRPPGHPISFELAPNLTLRALRRSLPRSRHSGTNSAPNKPTRQFSSSALS
ncbi:hypothetical protein HDF11_000366 [Tunturiibacter psychrotolerans]